MQFPQLYKAVVLSAATLAASYSIAASVNDHRSDSVPARPNHKTLMQKQMMDHGSMCDEKAMASCCEEMHQKMCDEMMEGPDSAMPCHERMSGSTAS